jgi:hypothetical protein
VACAEYWLAVPGSADRVAVVGCAVVGPAPCAASFDAMDRLAATAAFLIPEAALSPPAL